MKTRTFIDRARVHVRAGKGGNGSASFRRESFVPLGGPDGGDGGRGGHVYFKASHNVDSLIALYFAPQLFAENGVDGRGKQMTGRRGKDLVVQVPCGTEVYDFESGEMLADVVETGKRVLIARGGEGGLGNLHFKSSTHQAPTEHTPGEPGEEFRLRLELKIIADAGLLGFPNAGKSSLLARISGARPKVANYPFTTLNPIVGTVEYSDFSQLRVADVPGIIEGAASGVGLGIEFLRHISRSRMLIYVIDMAGFDNREPWDDYLKLHREVEQYDPQLLERPALVVANKMDIEGAAEKLEEFKQRTGVVPLPLSTVVEDSSGIEELKVLLKEFLKPEPRGRWLDKEREAEAVDHIAVDHIAVADSESEIEVDVEHLDGEYLREDDLSRAPFLKIEDSKKKRKRARE